MSYNRRVTVSYPAPLTGTAQDLFRVVTRSYELQLEREGTVLPVKTAGQRRFVEPVFRALGAGLGAVMEIVPADWTVAFHDKLFGHLSSPRAYAFDPAEPRVARAAALAAKLEAETGKTPALLALISHPPVMGELAHLNFELVRRATAVLRATRGRPCRPRLVTAIDPFALDTAAIWEEGLYAGYMGSFHVGVDRLALGAGRPGVALTPRAAWTRMPRRLLGALSAGGEVGLVLSGGVPATGRVLYGAREWARLVRHRSPLAARPADALARLRADASFARYEAFAAASLLPPRRAWDALAGWLMAAQAGLLPGETATRAAAAALEALSVPVERHGALLAELARDLEKETPTRERLFRLLAGRVARRRPVVLLPIVHSTEPLGVESREAWALEWRDPGRISVRRADAPERIEETTPEKFAARFVGENFA
jgi:hypothetical protein